VRSYTVSTNKSIVIAEYGGFKLSEKAKGFIAAVKNLELNQKGLREAESYAMINRDSDSLLLCLRLLGSVEASEVGSFLKVVEIPYDVEWYIQEINGKESVVEKHRVWV